MLKQVCGHTAHRFGTHPIPAQNTTPNSQADGLESILKQPSWVSESSLRCLSAQFAMTVSVVRISEYSQQCMVVLYLFRCANLLGND